MTKRQVNSITILSIVVVILALMLSNRLWFRLDLSKNKAYTISAISRRLHEEIPDEVRITYYISGKLASIHPLPGEIEDLLREYAAYSRGKIRIVLRDPVKANLIEEIEQMGILPQQIQTVDQGETSIATVYTGIVIEYLDQAEILPVVFSLETLEYDLTSRIRSLVSGVERQTGIIVGDSYRQWNQDYGYLGQALLQAGYRTRLLAPGEEISENLPSLVVLGGVEDFDDWALYRIDRYIQGGGKVFFAAEAVFVDSQGGSLEARSMNDRGLLSMLASYGAEVTNRLVLDTAALTLQYQSRQANGVTQYRIIRYPHWIGVLPQNGNPKNPVTARFSGVDLFWPSPITVNAPPGIGSEELFASTPEAWLMTNNFVTNPDTAFLFENEAEATRGREVLAVSLSGVFPSYFRGRDKPQREGSEEELPALPPRGLSSRIIVVGDTDFLTAMLQFTRGERNLEFFIQALDWLSSDDEIIGIRNREALSLRLDRIADPQRRKAVMNFAQVLNIVLVPAGLLALAFFLAWRRKKRALSSGITGA
ncbi:MAG: GldG family protein [Treponema sp.]|jgi:ABC-type uncharacterized transport system involved in gliding motility auxiliary subunit|nr:GldG family protein [Treponema sp.]